MTVSESQSGAGDRSLNVLAVEPYYGGSHRDFLDSVAKRSRHRWTLITGPPRHWKWRMRNAPLALAHQLIDELTKSSSFDDGFPDLIFCSDMLDLPQWRGFLCRPTTFGGAVEPRISQALQQIAGLPAISYFHENQWTYPQSPQARDDAHYGYTNLLTALASDESWFNSQFHRQSFLDASREFISRMPDERHQHDLDGLESRCHVVHPGFDPIEMTLDPVAATEELGANDHPRDRQTLRIGWASRWEHDKRPDRFEQLLQILCDRGLSFELILLGARPRVAAEVLATIEAKHAGRIRFSGYAKSRSDYVRWLREMDVIVSTADHEFFGIAVCEAISAGAIPVLPDSLSYPELVEERFRYRSLEQAADMIQSWSRASDRRQVARACRDRILPFALERTIRRIDDGIDRVVTFACGSEQLEKA